MANTTLTPSVGQIRLTTDLAPLITSGAIALVGGAPSVALGAPHIVPAIASVAFGGSAPILSIVAASTAGSVVCTGLPPVIRMTYAAPPLYLRPAAASIPIPQPGYYYLLPQKAA